MQDNSQFIVGLDVGTSKIRVVVGLLNDGAISIVGTGEALSNGMRKGIVSDMTSLSQTIDQALGEAEKTSGFDIDAATVSLNGSSIASTKADAMIAIAGQDIGLEDVNRLEELVTVGKIPDNRVVLKVIPHDYILDGQSGIKDPVGMSGSRLELKANVISTLSPHLDGLEKVAKAAQVQLSQAIVAPLAAARASLTEKQMNNGVAIIDLGASTTGIAIYEDGDLQYATVLPIGANHITNDLALGLQIKPEIAEKVKLTHAAAIFHDQPKRVSIKHEKQIYEFDQTEIDEIVEMRLRETFEYVHQRIKRAGYDGKLPDGIVLSGGGAKMSGIDNYVKNALGLVTSIAQYNHQFKGLTDKIADVEYMTAVGLMLYDLETVNAQSSQLDKPMGLLSGIKKLFKR